MAGRGEREVRVTVLGDSKGGQRALAELDDRADKTGRHFDGLGGKVAGFAKAAAIGLGGAAVAAGGFMAKAISSGSDLAESLSKSNTIFGESGAAMEKWAAGAARDFGQSKKQALEAGASFGNMFTQLGIGTQKAAGMSRQMVELASDFASFHNADITEVLQAQQAAFRGEYDSVQRFVPTINAAAVEQEALKMGLAKTTKELTDQDKALAVQSLMMKGAGAAMGDYDRTSKGFANRMRELKARGEDFAASVGTAVLPMVLRLMDVAEELGGKLAVGFGALKSAFSGEGITSDGFVGVMERIGVTAREVWDNVREAWPQIKATIMGAVEAIVGWVREHWPEIKKIIVETIETVREVVVGVVEVLTTIWENFGEQITDVAKAAWKFVRDMIESTLKVIQGLVKVITSLIKGDWSGVWEGIKQILDGAWQSMQARIEMGLTLIKNIISAALEIVKAIFSGAWNAVFEVTRNVLAVLVDVWLGTVDVIISAAARAFGWVPGLGPKLRQAADWFHEFRENANDAIRGIDGNIPISADTTRFWDEYWRARAAAERGIAIEVSNQPGGGEGVGYAGIQKFHSGLAVGPVRGTPGRDVGIIAKPGEWVATPEQMAALVSGRSGGSSAGGNVYVTVGTLVGSDGMHELAEIIRTKQLQYQRRVPGLGYE
jgi:hypothetical protein